MKANGIWLTTREVAKYLSVSRQTIWIWIKAGKLPASKIGQQWRVNETQLEKWLLARQRAGKESA